MILEKILVILLILDNKIKSNKPNKKYNKIKYKIIIIIWVIKN